MCADAQETVTISGTDYRRAVQKIIPQEMGQFQVAIGGCGNPNLIESFILRLKRSLDRTTCNGPEKLDRSLIGEGRHCYTGRDDA